MNFFEIFAECSIALAGFGAVHAVLRGSTSPRIAQLSSVIAILAMFANLIGWPWPSGPVLYATAPILILIIGLVALLLAFLVPQLVLRGEPSGPPDDAPVT